MHVVWRARCKMMSHCKISEVSSSVSIFWCDLAEVSSFDRIGECKITKVSHLARVDGWKIFEIWLIVTTAECKLMEALRFMETDECNVTEVSCSARIHACKTHFIRIYGCKITKVSRLASDPWTLDVQRIMFFSDFGAQGLHSVASCEDLWRQHQWWAAPEKDACMQGPHNIFSAITHECRMPEALLCIMLF